MSHTIMPGLAPPRLAPRVLRSADWPRVLDLARQTPSPPWVGDLRSILTAGGVIGWLVETEKRVLGFAVCRYACCTQAPSRRSLGKLALHLFGLGGRPREGRLEMDLLDLRVAPGCGETEVERTLLTRLNEDLRQSAAQVAVVVPESSLSVQLFLREVGYRATEVLHDYFETEDGYCMVG